MMPSRRELKGLFLKAVQGARYAGVERGFLGRATASGQYDFDVPGMPHWMWARVWRGSTQTIIKVINYSVPRDPAIPILIGRSIDGDPIVLSADHTMAARTLQSVGPVGAGPHSHALGGGLEDMVEALRFEPGLVHPLSALTVFVKPFFYRWQGGEAYYPGGSIDLTTYRPGTANQWCWVKVGVDPATNEAVAVKGADYALTLPLSPPLLQDIDFGDYIPCAGVKLRSGQAAIEDWRDFQDARLWLSDVATIHDNAAGEISAIVEKTTPVSADLLLLEDSEAGYAKKKVQIGSLPGGSGTDPDAIHDNAAGEINAVAEKTTPVSADLLLLEDSEAGYAKKKVQIGSLPGGGGGGAGMLATNDLIGQAAYETKVARVEGYNIPVSSTYTICHLTGQSGMMLTLWLAISGSGPHRDSVVKIYVDGEGSPSVQFDIGTLGLHFATGEHHHFTQHVGVEQDPANYQAMVVFRFPVPFATELKIDVQNVSSSVQARTFAQVFYTNDLTDSRRLKSANLTWLNRASVPAANTYQFLNYSGGPGCLVWHSLAAQGATNLSYLERDVQVAVDGASPAAIISTGTEDWFSGAFFYTSGARSYPWAMTPFIGTAAPYRSIQGVDLLEAFGGVRFDSSIAVTWDTEAAVTSAVDISYLLLYYTGSVATDNRREVTVQTTDAVATDLLSIPVAEGQVITLRGIVAGGRADEGAACGGDFSATFRRAAGGSVTLVGVVNSSVQEDSAASPTFAVAADTTHQAAVVRVTGVAGETWDWQAFVEWTVRG